MLSEPAGDVQYLGDQEVAVDGRAARRVRGRAAAVQAVVELFDEGELRPSADEVVARAGISAASLYRYFRGLDELYRAGFDQQLARATHIATIGDLDGRSLDDRVREFVARRIDAY